MGCLLVQVVPVVVPYWRISTVVVTRVLYLGGLVLLGSYNIYWYNIIGSFSSVYLLFYGII